MGNYISNNSFYLLLKRSTMRYNAENRAYKEMQRQQKKPVVAPKYDAGIIDYQKLLKENKVYIKESNTQNKDLDNRLKDVYVTSKGDNMFPERATLDKPLPVNRTSDVFEIGYKESAYIPPGKVSLVQAMKFITDHRENPIEWTINKIANDNKLKVEVASDIIKHFHAYEVFFPKTSDQKAIDDNSPKRLKLIGITDKAPKTKDKN